MPIRAPEIAKLGRCRLIAKYGVGYDIFDIEAAGKAGQSSELWVSGTPTAIEVVTKGDQVWGINAVKGKITVE